MSRNARWVVICTAILLGTLSPGIASEVAEAEEPAGEALFHEHKCQLCHAVPAASIDAKTKSDKMRGADLGGPVEVELEILAAYLRKQGQIDGKEHRREFKGTDEELQTIVDWLAQLAPEPEDAGDSPD